MSIRAVCLDLDDVICHEGFTPDHPIICDEAMAVLDYLRIRQATGLKIILASHNLAARTILDRLEIADRFDLILGYHDWTDKASHLRKVLDEYGLQPAQVILFDDLS